MGTVAKLFQAVVALGAAFGCGGESRSGTADAGAGFGTVSAHGMGGGGMTARDGGAGEGLGPAVSTPGECAAPAQFTCADFEFWDQCHFTYDPECDTPRARDNCHCDPSAPRRASDCPATQQFSCWGGSYSSQLVACRCDPNAPVAPSDCAFTQQYHCLASEPDAECSCDPDAPLGPSDCAGRKVFRCRSDDPPTDCRCLAPPG